MKLFIVTCLKEHKKDVSVLFKQADIHAFSTTEITGNKESEPSNLLEDWFASGGEQFDSMMIFSFTSSENANQAMGLIENYNKTHDPKFPVRAFIVPVEKSNYQ